MKSTISSHIPENGCATLIPGSGHFSRLYFLVAMIARLLGLSALGPRTRLAFFRVFLVRSCSPCCGRVLSDLSQSGRAALVLTLPVLWSNSFYLSSLFLVTENAASLGYALLLLAYLGFPRRSALIGLVGQRRSSVPRLCCP